MNTCKNCKKCVWFFESFNTIDNECLPCYNIRMKIREVEHNRLFDITLNQFSQILEHDNDKLLKVIALLCLKNNIRLEEI